MKEYPFAVRDFGAKGDGKTDDTAAIQKALDAAGEVQETVFVPAGVYLSSTLRVPPHVGMTGRPAWDYGKAGGSILQLIDPDAQCLLDLSAGVGATISGLSCIISAIWLRDRLAVSMPQRPG